MKTSRISLEVLQDLPCGYPEADGTATWILWRKRIYLLVGRELGGRLHVAWVRPIIRVKARSVRA